MSHEIVELKVFMGDPSLCLLGSHDRKQDIKACSGGACLKKGTRRNTSSDRSRFKRTDAAKENPGDNAKQHDEHNAQIGAEFDTWVPS